MNSVGKADWENCQGMIIDGRFLLEQFLAEGGFGAVFRGSHLAYGTVLRPVAIKISKNAMSEEEARVSFCDALLTARLVGSSRDPEITRLFVAVYDAGRCQHPGPLAGHPYMVMELVEGETLRSAQRSSPFPLMRAMASFEPLLRAVAFMHQPVERPDGTRQPIIHRDIKPDNILVCRDESGSQQVKLADFGCAVEIDTLLGWTQSGGDLAYLAPESFSDEVSSPQSDVYMLALVFYEMIAGRNPFAEVGQHLRGDSEANRLELRRLHLASRLNERFPCFDSHEELRCRPELAEVIRSALRADAHSRPFRNAGEFHQAWSEAQGGMASADQRPWEVASRLAAEADQCYRMADVTTGDHLLSQALELNRQVDCVPDHLVVGAVYLFAVKRRIAEGKLNEAGLLAKEGYSRRRCRSTILAMAAYCTTQNPRLARDFEEEARGCKDSS